MVINANRIIKNRYPKGRYMRPKEVCSHFNIAPSTLWKWVQCGKFPKPIRPSAGFSIFDKADIKAWLNSSRPKAASVEQMTSGDIVQIEKLVALIEARQFPIGADFSDPLARRFMTPALC